MKLILLEVIINVQSHFNEVIYYSFNGEIEKKPSIILNINGLCFILVFIFAMWDAYKDAGGGKELYSFLPFVLSAYFVTVGLMYSAKK
ncbi:hypothetical protein GCM10020331_003770 [Ectobacillus funiculus]